MQYDLDGKRRQLYNGKVISEYPIQQRREKRYCEKCGMEQDREVNRPGT